MPIALLTMLLALGAAADSQPVSTWPPAAGLGLTGGAGGAGAHASQGFDKEIIRTIIRQHLDEVKGCYEPELTKQRDLFGKIMVQFTIAHSGEVIASVRQSSTLGNPRVEDCIVKATRRWRFPIPPNGGIVIVSYPFVLMPDAPIPLLAGTKGAGAVSFTVVDLDSIVHRSTDERGIPSNGLIAVTAHGLLLVDTAWTEAETEAVLKWGEARLGQPWVGAIITHDHADRDGGLAALQRRHIPIAALDLTVAKLQKRGMGGVTTLFTAKAGALQDPRGFEAFYPGPGHTSDNIVLKFPQVLFGGCLIKAADAPDLGFTGDADLASWPAAVQRVAARYPKVKIIPGHGPIDRTGAAYQHTIDLLAGAGRNRWGAH